MVSKKILGVAIAAAFSSQAFATVDLNAGTGAFVYAKESITNAQVVSGLVQVTTAGAGADLTALNATVKIGFGVSAGAHAFIRFDLTNGKLKNAVVPANLSDVTTAGNVPAANVVVAQGGAAGDAYVIFDVTATASGIPQADVLQLALAGLQIDPSSATTLKFAHYSTSPDAVNKTNALASASAQEASVANVLKTDIAAADRIADVNASPAFTQFVSPASATASIGSVKFSLGTAGAVDATGVPITTLNQLIDNTAGKSSLTVSGDLSFTAAPAGAGAAAATALNVTFGGVASDVLTPATNTTPSGKLTTLTNAAFALGNTSNVALTATGPINPGAYSLTAAFTGITNAAYAPAAATGALGTIKRNGATVQVPYLTTNTGLNQKVVLVNRGSSDTTYTTTFTTENGVTAAAGTAASGTLKAKQTLVLKAADLVTLTGGTRTAATIVALTPASNVDAATQTVVTDPASVSFGSNDTVNLDVK